MLGSRKHILLAGLMATGMTVVALVWAAGVQSNSAATPATTVPLQQESSGLTLGEQAEQASAVVDQTGDSSNEPSNGDTQATTQEQEETKSNTSEEIEAALDDLDLGGWDDSELSNKELGLPL